MVNLVLSMIAAYEDYESDMRYTMNDINNFIAKYNLKDELAKCNERGWIVLWRNKYISDEEFARLMEIVYEDDNFWLVSDDFSDLLSDKYSLEAELLNGEFDWTPGEFYEVDVEDFWSMYDTKTLQEIIDCCIKNEYELEGELMTKENTKLEDDDIYFHDTKLVEYIGNEDLSELKNGLNRAICEAQDAANYDETFKRVKDNFEKDIGEFKWKTIKIGNKENKDVEKLYVKFGISWNDIEYDLKNQYGNYNFEDENYGNLFYILREIDYFNFKTPNYDYIYGDIDEGILNEYTRSNLNWI